MNRNSDCHHVRVGYLQPSAACGSRWESLPDCAGIIAKAICARTRDACACEETPFAIDDAVFPTFEVVEWRQIVMDWLWGFNPRDWGSAGGPCNGLHLRHQFAGRMLQSPVTRGPFVLGALDPAAVKRTKRAVSWRILDDLIENPI
jgi:hypothetical protein